jgi:hypothetical protein
VSDVIAVGAPGHLGPFQVLKCFVPHNIR